MQTSYSNTTAKYLVSIVMMLASFCLSSQTILLSDGFENGKGSWIFSTSQGGNDYLIKSGYGYNSTFAVRCGTLGNPNFMISPVVSFEANKPYKISFMAYSSRTNSRKIEVYYNQTAALNGSETLIGTIDEVPVTYTSFTVNLSNPPAGNYYIILKGIIKANTWVDLCIDDIKVVRTQNYIPTVTITHPANNATPVAGQPLTVVVDAADTDGTITQVKLFYRSELFGTALSSPYEFTIPNIPIGSSTVYAKAYDNSGDSITTPVLTFTGVNTAPSCTVAVSSATINQGDPMTFSAEAVDTDGNIESVSFFVNNERVANVTTAPYTFRWSSPKPGIYNVFAVATDNTGLTGNSDTLTIASAASTFGYILSENFEDGVNNWKLSTNSGGNDWRWQSSGGVNGTACLRRQNTGLNFLTNNNICFFEAATYQVNISAKSQSANTYYLQAGLINGVDTVWSNLSNAVTTSFSTISLAINNPKASYCYFIVRGVKAGTSTYVEFFVDDISVIGSGGMPNIGPTVKVLSPANLSELSLNTPVAISAQAYDLNGTVSKVEYFIGKNKIGESSISPYSVSWTPSSAGVYSLKAVCTDNEGQLNMTTITVYVNYSDRKVYDYIVSSYLGEEAGSGKVWGAKVLSDGVIVLACDWGALVPEGAILHLLNGANGSSRGTIVRISADGKKILSLTKIADYAVDLSIDDSDNLYVAAANKGMIKLNRLADKMLDSKVFNKNVYRVDAGKTGYSAVLARAGYDFDGKKWDKVSVFVMDPLGNILTSFGGASTYTNDVCIDETTQSVVVVGWRNIYTNAKDNGNWLPVDIPGYKIYSFSGTLKYEGYNWSGDPSSPDWLNRSENNMADTRIARVSVGDDGILYFMAEVSGGNHPLRYSPYDIMKKVRFVGGDHFHVLSQVGTEFHTFIGRINLHNGEYVEGQSFTARLSSGAGNTLEAEHGNVQADEDGRVYFTGSSASGLPLTRDSLASLSYTGGAFIYVMNPTLQIREYVDRVVIKNNGYDIGVRKFANYDKTIVYGGSVSYDAAGKEKQYQLFLKNPLQSVFYGEPNQQSGFFAMIGGTIPATYQLTINGEVKGMYTEGTKIPLDANDYSGGLNFIRWSNGENYISDSTSVTTVFSMPGKNISLNALCETLTTITEPHNLKFKIYPNPAADRLYVSTNSLQPVKLTITDLTGKMIMENIIQPEASLDLKLLAKGVYIVSVEKHARQKLIVQ